jgi:hypothetical protein
LWGSNAPLLVGIIASKPLSPLSFDSSPLSSISTPCSQIILQQLGLTKLDANHVFSYSSDIALPLNSIVLVLNQTLCGFANLSILH